MEWFIKICKIMEICCPVRRTITKYQDTKIQNEKQKLIMYVRNQGERQPSK